MAQYANDIRGEGLTHLHDALGNPEDRLSYEEPSLSSISHRLTGSGRSVTGDELKQLEKLYWELVFERTRSWPDAQFNFQYYAEVRRLQDQRWANSTRVAKEYWDEVGRHWKQHSRVDLLWIKGPELNNPTYFDPYHEALENIKKSWIEQGIWRSEWNAKHRLFGRWKHEYPLESDQPNSLFALPPTDEEKRKIAEGNAVRERERAVSRPYHQFVYQVSKRREQIENEPISEEGKLTADINTRAYEYVKNLWVEQKIWNDRWGDMPGMTWKHEDSFEEQLADRLGIDSIPPEDLPPVNHTKKRVGSSLFGFSEEEPNHSTVANGSQQETRQEAFSFITDSCQAQQPTLSLPHSGDFGLFSGPREQNVRRESSSTIDTSVNSGHSTKMSKSSKTSLSQQPGASNNDDGETHQPPNMVVEESKPLAECDECRRIRNQQASKKESTTTGSRVPSSTQMAPEKVGWKNAGKLARIFREMCNKA